MTSDDPANDGDSSLTLADTLAETVTTLSKAVEEITIKPVPKIYCDKAVQTELLELELDLEPLDSKVLTTPAEPVSTPASTSASSFTSFFTSESDSAFEAEPESKTEPSPSCESTPTRNTPAAQSESTVPVSTSLLDISPIHPTTKAPSEDKVKAWLFTQQNEFLEMKQDVLRQLKLEFDQVKSKLGQRVTQPTQPPKVHLRHPGS